MIETNIFSYNQLSSSIREMITIAHESLLAKFPYTSKAIYAVNQALFKDFPASVAKAVYIDSPIYLSYESSISKALYGSSVAGISYEIRSQVKTYIINHGESKYAAGIMAGMMGGGFRYFFLNQNPLIGAMNNMIYETCNNFDSCANNPSVNVPLTILVESVDASLHAIEQTTNGNIVGAVLNAAFGGVKIGAFVCANVHKLYIPASKAATMLMSTETTDAEAFQNITESPIELSGDTYPSDSNTCSIDSY